MRDDELSRLVDEKRAQLEGATAVLKPLAIVADLVVFALCFWRYNFGVVLSIGAAVLTHFVVIAGLSFSIGYVLGKRSARCLPSICSQVCDRADLAHAGGERPHHR